MMPLATVPAADADLLDWIIDPAEAGLSSLWGHLGRNDNLTEAIPTPGHGSFSYGGTLIVDYQTYDTTVSFGNDIVTSLISVDVITGTTRYPFDQYFGGADIDGVLGIGPNNRLPGTSTVIPALPDALNDGVLINEPQGYLQFGPNPLTGFTSVIGAPVTTLDVLINGVHHDNAGAFIDSGGVYGAVPSSMVPGADVNESLPARIPISVYTEDGQLLYSYDRLRLPGGGLTQRVGAT